MGVAVAKTQDHGHARLPLWHAGYDGPPQVSFSANEAAEIGLKLGDRITVNILGRDIEAEITSFRAVDFSNAGMGFVMALDAAALRARSAA